MSRRGFTLVETLIVVVIMGLMMLIGYPKIRQQLIQSDVRAATGRIVAAYAQARASAMQTGRTTTFNAAADRVWVTAPNGGGLDTVGSVQYVGSAYKVALAVDGAATLQLDGRGLLATPLADPAEIRIQRGDYAKAVRIGRYGTIDVVEAP